MLTQLFALTLVGMALPVAAVAQTTTMDTLRHRPSISTRGGIALDSTSVRRPWQWDGSFWIGAERHPIVLRQDGVPTEPALTVRVPGQMVFGVNLGRWVRLGVGLPFALYQEGVDPVTGVPLPKGGVGDLRLVPQVMLLDPDRRPLGLSILVPVTFPTGRSQAWLSETTPTIEPRLVAEARIRRHPVARFALTGQGGFHARPATRFIDYDSSWEVTAGLGLRWEPLDTLALGTELVGAFGRGAAARQGEWTAFLRLRFTGTVALGFVAGGSVGIGHGVGTPEGRVFLALRGIVSLPEPGQRPRSGGGVERGLAEGDQGKSATAIDPKAPVGPLVRLAGGAGGDAADPSSGGIVAAQANLAVSRPPLVALRSEGPPIPRRGPAWDAPLVTLAASKAIAVNALFHTGSAAIREDARALLTDVVAWVGGHGQGVVVEIDGYADARGSPRYNQDLSRLRAESVRDALISYGLDEAQVALKGHGEGAAVVRAGVGDDDMMQSDRRVELRIRVGAKAGVGTRAAGEHGGGPSTH